MCIRDRGLMIHDELVEIFGARFACVDKGFGNNKPVDVVIRPEDIDLLKPEEGTLQGIVTHLIFKGVHYEMAVSYTHLDVYKRQIWNSPCNPGIKITSPRNAAPAANA